jgi:hypothetical protein
MNAGESRAILMKEPGLDHRHRDKDGKIQQKRGDTKNRNLSSPIPGFGDAGKDGQDQRERYSERGQAKAVGLRI